MITSRIALLDNCRSEHWNELVTNRALKENSILSVILLLDLTPFIYSS
jgi:hypothetical protein